MILKRFFVISSMIILKYLLKRKNKNVHNRYKFNRNNILRRNGTTNSKPHRGGNSNSSGSNNFMDQRVKKIVAMPASLYNHFNPVESNIPIEDMSQFLYFGQKLRGTGKCGTKKNNNMHTQANIYK